MKSIYDLLLEWHQIDPNFIFLRDKKSYTLNEVVHEVESISKSLSYIPSEIIAIYLSSKLDFILVYLACIKSNKIPMILKNDMVIQFHEERLIDLEERSGTQ